MATPDTKPDPAEIVAYKGLDKDFRCRGFQYEVGQTYELPAGTKPARCTSRGFHWCENPLDIWTYYGVADGTRYAEVRPGGAMDRDCADTKGASTRITISAEITLGDLIDRSVDWVMTLVKGLPSDTPDASGYAAQIGSSGYAARIGSSGDAAQIGSSGDAARIGSSGYDARIGSSGYAAQIGSSGYAARIGSSGDAAQIGSSGDAARIGSSGYDARIGSSGYAAQIGSSGYAARIGSSGDAAQIGSSGDAARIGSSGYDARIGSSGYAAQIGSSGYAARIGSSGDDARIAVTGTNAIVAAAGRVTSITLGPGGCAALPWHDGTRARFVTLYEGEGGIKAGVAYCLRDGKPVEAA